MKEDKVLQKWKKKTKIGFYPIKIGINQKPTLKIETDNIVIHHKTLDIEINLKDKIKNFESIIIDGIEFVRKDNKK